MLPLPPPPNLRPKIKLIPGSPPSPFSLGGGLPSALPHPLVWRCPPSILRGGGGKVGCAILGRFGGGCGVL